MNSLPGLDWASGPSVTHGWRVILSDHLVERVPHPRSPARAKRRTKKGHPQCMKLMPIKKAFIIGLETVTMHPAQWEQIKARLTVAQR